MVKDPLANAETQVRALAQEGPLENEMTTHSSILAWEIPRTEEPREVHTVRGVTKSWTRVSELTCILSWRGVGAGTQCEAAKDRVWEA